MKTFERISQFVSNTFVVWVLFFAALAFFFPKGFSWIGDYNSILLGIIMYGMGMTLSLDDFKEVFKQPKKVAIGVVAQFVIMPVIAFGLAVGLQLSPEVAIGVILVGCCPGGTASNVITYLAKGNTALSVAITSLSTLLAPVVTPTLTLLFASKWLPVSAGDMFLSVLKMVLVPIILGLITKVLFRRQVEKSVKILPFVSVICIVAIVAAVVSGNHQKIAETGLLILFVVILHNSIGLLLGYMLAKMLKMDLPDRKAISIEVGMQNSALGATLAAAHFSPLAAVPSAIFSVWHNISGPLLATWWGRQKKEPEKADKKGYNKKQA